MKIVLAAFCFLALAAADTGKWSEQYLTVKFGELGVIDSSCDRAYFKVPREITTAQEQGWLPIENPNEFNLKSLSWKGTDYRIVVLYLDNMMVGVQVAMSKQEIDSTGPASTDLMSLGVYEDKVIDNTEVYAGTAYFFDPEIISKGERIYSDRLGDGFWVKNGTGFTKLPDTLSELIEENVYTKQSCIPMMGSHWYYQMDENADCDKFIPYFLMYTCGHMNGYGFQLYGKASIEPQGRNWWDSINRLKAVITVPHSPKCLGEYVSKYQSTSVHIYFTDRPWKINCITDCWFNKY